MYGTFSEKALFEFSKLASIQNSADFSEGETYDFARCVRPDGTYYGTSGRCRKGTETDPKENVDKMLDRLDKQTSIFKKKTSKKKENEKEQALTKQTEDWINDLWKSVGGEKGPVKVLDTAGRPPGRNNGWLWDPATGNFEGKIVTPSNKTYNFHVVRDSEGSLFKSWPAKN